MLIESLMIKLLIASVYFVLGKPLLFFFMILLDEKHLKMWVPLHIKFSDIEPPSPFRNYLGNDRLKFSYETKILNIRMIKQFKPKGKFEILRHCSAQSSHAHSLKSQPYPAQYLF